MRVVLMKGVSGYGVLRRFIDEIAAAFHDLGYEPAIVDYEREPDLAAALQRQAELGDIALVYSLNIFGDLHDQAGRHLGEMLGAPHVLHYVDYPLTHLTRLERTSPGAILLTVDPSHAAAVRSVWGDARFAHAGFLPHAAIGETVDPGSDPQAFAAARPHGLTFIGSFYKPRPPEWRDLPRSAQDLFEAAVELALSVEWTPALDALDSAMRSRGLDPLSADFAAVRKLAFMVHEHVRRERRAQLFRAAEALDLPIHVAGGGYDRELHRCRNVTYLGPLEVVEALALMARSRVVLSANANFGAGSHERPLSALKAGAAAASDYSAFYAESFVSDAEMALYRWQDLEAGLARIGELAADPQAAWAMARAGQQRVLAEHGWRNRAQEILAVAEAVRARAAPTSA